MTETEVQYKPEQSYLLIKTQYTPDRVGSIIVPEQSRQICNEGVVIDQGPLVIGQYVGKKIVYRRNMEYVVRFDGEQYSLVPEAEILCSSK